MRQRWAIENRWHWVRDVPLREEAHRYREGNGVQILATLSSLAINALRLDGIWSITEGIAALAHAIKGLLRLLGWRQAEATGGSENFYSPWIRAPSGFPSQRRQPFQKQRLPALHMGLPGGLGIPVGMV